MIGYVLLHVASNELAIDCTDDMTVEDYGMSGRVWYDKGLAADAAAAHNAGRFSSREPVYIAEVTLPDLRE